MAALLPACAEPPAELYDRAALLRALFRETDRVQRMNTPLCLMVFGLDDFAHWRARFVDADVDPIIIQVVNRIRRLLRSYDLLGRVGRCELAVGLPGCSPANAASLAERIREVLLEPFTIAGTHVQLTAGFGIAPSDGRSPVVVLREAEQALASALAAGPDSIRTRSQPNPAGLAFLTPTGRTFT